MKLSIIILNEASLTGSRARVQQVLILSRLPSGPKSFRTFNTFVVGEGTLFSLSQDARSYASFF